MLIEYFPRRKHHILLAIYVALVHSTSAGFFFRQDKHEPNTGRLPNALLVFLGHYTEAQTNVISFSDKINKTLITPEEIIGKVRGWLSENRNSAKR